MITINIHPFFQKIFSNLKIYKFILRVKENVGYKIFDMHSLLDS